MAQSPETVPRVSKWLAQVDFFECGWDLESPCFLFASSSPQIHCISTVFVPSKTGGEKGVPFHLQIHTFKASDSAPALSQLPHQSVQVLTVPRSQCRARLASQPSCSDLSALGQAPVPREDLNPGASILAPQQWLHQHLSSSYCEMLTNFTGLFPQCGPDSAGTDLLKLTRQDLVQICRASDGICPLSALRANALPAGHFLSVAVFTSSANGCDSWHSQAVRLLSRDLAMNSALCSCL
ncbi:upstream-binding protein 1-like [Neovison vison]|uniref:upstream-binding protein 1-like n=1 Tax=Neovison vison TaxID=452646 RepID=UPI001CF08FB3|nr:upstream-binding protein 1-like [Neogale vison]